MNSKLRFLLVILVALLVTLGYAEICTVERVQATALAQTTQPLTVAQLKNAEYRYRTQYAATRTVQLIDGHYENPENGLRVELTKNYIFGDLNNDGTLDAAAILSSTIHGGEPFFDLVALTALDSQTAIGGMILLGEGIKIEKLTIVNGEIVLAYQRPQLGIAPCCPARRVTQHFFSRRGLLVLKQTKSFALLFPYKSGNLYGYVNVLGEVVIEAQFVLAGEFSEGMAVVSYDGRTTGFINQSGELIISPRFSYAGSFFQGLAIVGLPGVDADAPFLTAYIDRLGNLVFGDQRFLVAEPFSEGVAAVSLDGEHYGYINLQGVMVIEPQFTQAESFSEGLAPVQIVGHYGFINRVGKLIIPPQFEAAEPFKNGRAQVELAGKTGYINHQGEVVIEPLFDYGYDFSEGLALVIRAGKLSYIDELGNVAIDLPELTRAANFAEGLAVVTIGEAYGYIDRQGKLVIPTQFTYAGDFKHGLAVVESADIWGLVNSNGELVLEMSRKNQPVSPQVSEK